MDDSAFQHLIDTGYDPLYRFALSLARKSDDALDLSRQSFARWAEQGHTTAARRATYDRLVGAASPPAVPALARFHRQHDADDGAFSMAMRRPDAAARSPIHVAARRGRVTLRYEALQWPAD